MDCYQELIASHSNLSVLEDAAKMQRVNLMTACKAESGANSQWLIAKASYCGLANALNQEMAKFQSIMDRLDGTNVVDTKTEPERVSESEPQQTLSEEVQVRDDAESSPECQPVAEHAELYKDSVTLSENSSVHSIEEDEDQKTDKKEMEQENEEKKKVEVAVNENEHSEVAKCEFPSEAEQTQQVETVKVMNKRQRQSKKKRTKKVSGPLPQTVLATPTWNVGDKKKGIAVSNNRSGYKYKGNGFSVYKGKPIYSVTTLFCRETFGFDQDKVKAFLTKSGGFSAKKIRSVSFKNGQFDSFCLIKLRAPMTYIRQKMKVLNGDENVLHIFHRRQTVARKASRCLFVSNFDILNRMSHKKMTNLLSRYGELAKDIEIKTDSFGNPMALVYFKDLNEAISCCQASKTDTKNGFVFDGKALDITFNKF